MVKRKEGAISAELLDQLLAGRDPGRVLESGGLDGRLKKGSGRAHAAGSAEFRPTRSSARCDGLSDPGWDGLSDCTHITTKNNTQGWDELANPRALD